ncbi:phage tail protein [uncultured Streptococcus sp.]|uniref:phage tail protein n=1 Tax=uncultured Streptococcus sp. TaxID=83427 RepID=UPI00266602FD|nr:phage tail protein [uncultured Streptococcus sp.]
MITFLDERDVEHGALATIKVTNAVNGERSLTGEIESGDYVLTNIERGWRLRFDDEFYVVTYAKPIDDGKGTHVTFDAVHQFFWDFDKSSVHEQLNDGSHTFLTYLDFIFTGSDYTYTIDPLLKVYAFEKQSFGYKSRLKLFNDIITSSGVEFQVNGKVVRILEKTGTDLSTVVRKNFNMNELGIEKHIGDFVTYQKGFGAWADENDHSKGRLVTEYTSPLASVYGKLEAEPLVDERYTQADNMIAALKANVDNSYSLSIRLDMEDLTRAGYEYTQPRAGDYIMAINETLDFQEKIRIVSFTSEYDVSGQLVKHEVTCNDIGVVKKLSASYNLTKEQAKNASDSVGKAVEMANKALVSADGKSTVYFGNEFPKDEPKGTLHKGDSLYLTVGDTTKMYYWTGADWEELPIVNDVEAFKEQIADELKNVPNREEFEATITEKLATSKAEIKTQIDTAKMQAESNAKAYADEINQATAEVAEQANTAANTLKSDLAKVKTDLTTTTSTANAAKTSASEAKQQLAAVANDLSKAKTDLQNAVSAVDTKATNLQSDLTTAKQDLTNQASQLQAQASAQSELTKRVSSVEETANGTKTSVSELSKTVDSNTKNITSVTARTKVVEDDLLNTKTMLSQVKTTADSTSQKTATLETGLNGLTAKFNSLSVGGANLFKGSRDFSGTNWVNNYNDVYAENYQGVKIFKKQAMWAGRSQYFEVKAGEEYVFSAYVKSSAKTDNVGFYLVHSSKQPTAAGLVSFGSVSDQDNIYFDLTDEYQRIAIKIKITSDGWIMPRLERSNTNAYLFFGGYKLERGNVATDYNSNEADFEQKVAEYKQNADQNYASLQTTVQNLDGTVKANKTTAEQTAAGFKTRIESLETYKDGETTRASQYFELAKTETARQLTSERTAIAKDYVAKSTYTSDVTGIRNDLTATTTTANTTKTNLANYQASNDKVVANLQSNLQTANGNISSLQTKIEAVPGQITSAVSAVEGKIPTNLDSLNLMTGTRDWSTKTNAWHMGHEWTTESEEYQGLKVHSTQKGYNGSHQNIFVKSGDVVTFSFYAKATKPLLKIKVSPQWTGSSVYQAPLAGIKESDEQITITSEWKRYSKTVHVTSDGSLQFRAEYNESTIPDGNTFYVAGLKLAKSALDTGYSENPTDVASDINAISSEIKQTTDAITASVSSVETKANTAQSTANTAVSKADAAQAGVNTLDSTTVKSASLTINTDGIVMKAGKSTTDVANAIGSYFAVNQNAINLFSDKINVKGSMIVDGAITSTKIASKTIDTAHLNGKIITADVISSNAITADAIKAGAVTTDKMTANSINGDRITVGTLDAAKIKAGSISASQIASGTLTSEQIKAGAIKSINIEASAITSDKIASNSIDASKIVTNGLTANIIKGGKLQSLSNATNFELDTGKLFYNNNNTGVFRVEDGASTMGLKFTNTAITVNGSSKVLSRVILGGDRRESTLDDGKWDQGGFTGIVAETINGVASNTHDKADTLRAIADNIYFTHSYETDALTGVSAAGWKMETYAPDTSYKGNVVLKPYGVSYRQSNIVVGDLRLDNGDGSGYWMRATINVLKACFGHIVNGGVSGDALSAIRSELNKISGT